MLLPALLLTVIVQRGVQTMGGPKKLVAQLSDKDHENSRSTDEEMRSDLSLTVEYTG